MHSKGSSNLFFELRVYIAHNLMDLKGCSDSPDRIILVNSGDTEEGNHCIADEFFDCSFMMGNDLGDLAEDPVHNTFDFLGVEFFGEGGVP